jgi:hypothetical protein
MNLDLTRVGIALGILLCGAYSGICMWRRHRISPSTLWAVSAAGIGIPLGIKLILAGYTGNPSDLPPTGAKWSPQLVLSRSASPSITLCERSVTLSQLTRQRPSRAVESRSTASGPPN